MKIKLMVIPIVIAALSSFAHADEKMQLNIVDLSAELSSQVENDLMVIVLQATAQKNSSAEAADAVNQIMAWADPIITADDQIRYQSLNYQTRPVYHERSISGWTAIQQIRLEADSFESMTTMITTLQQQLQIVSMQFTVSEEKRKDEIDSLIVHALEAFTQKAELISQALRAQDHRLVAISIDENGIPGVYRSPVHAEAMTVRAAAPQVEAGDSKITVRVTGSIQLIF